MSDEKLIQVLDHGFVRLVDHMGNDLSIVRNARQSYAASWRAGEDDGSDTRLIRRLIKDRHTSPFESVEFQFEVHAPIFVARQWMRHRTWSYNELSARYTNLSEQFYIPEARQITRQSSTDKQARTDEQVIDAVEAQRVMEEANKVSFEAYRRLLKRGVARELARTVLPVSTYTNFFAKVDLLNLLKFFDLRLTGHAQPEIVVYAQAMLQLIMPVVPITVSEWHKDRHPPAAEPVKPPEKPTKWPLRWF